MMGYGTLRRANRKRVTHACYGCGSKASSATHGKCDVCSHRFCLTCMPRETDTRWLCSACARAVLVSRTTNTTTNTNGCHTCGSIIVDKPCNECGRYFCISCLAATSSTDWLCVACAEAKTPTTEPADTTTKCQTCGTHEANAVCGCGRALCFRCVCACCGIAGDAVKCSCGAPAECCCGDCRVPACGLHARNEKGNDDGGHWLCSDRECGNPKDAPVLPTVPVEPPKKARRKPSFVCDPTQWEGFHCWCAIRDSRCDETWEMRCPEGENGMAIATLATREVCADVREASAIRWFETLARAKRVPLDVHKLEQALLAAHADKRTTPCKSTCKAAEHYVTYRGTLFAACRIRSLLRAMRAMRAPVTHVYDVLGEDNGNMRVMAFTSGRAPGVVAVLCQIRDNAVTAEEKAALPSIDVAAA